MSRGPTTWSALVVLFVSLALLAHDVVHHHDSAVFWRNVTLESVVAVIMFVGVALGLVRRRHRG